jgi:hypothetical protein
MEFTWFTFPVYVALFTGIILWIGGSFMRSFAHQREVAVVDYYPEASFARKRAVEAILSPEEVVFQMKDAEPLDSEFLERSLYGQESEGMTSVTIRHDGGREVHDWALNRNATGLAVVDRCTREPSPLSYSVERMDRDGVMLTVRNGSETTYGPVYLATAQAVYSIAPIRPGTQGVGGSRFRDLASFRKSPPAVPAGGFGTNQGAAWAMEAQLNQSIHDLLESLCFPGDDPARSGIAAGLDASRWVESGGTVLLAWARESESLVEFDPAPGQRTADVLVRVFQGAAR